MIVKMMKVSVVTEFSRQAETLAALRKVGVLHPELSRGSSAELQELLSRRERLEGALRLLPETNGLPEPGRVEIDSALEAADEGLELGARIRSAAESRTELQREEERLAPWGEFDPGAVRELAERGVRILLYEAPIEAFERVAAERTVFIVQRTKTAVKFALVLMPGEEKPALQEAGLPKRGLEELRGLIAERSAELERLRRTLTERSVHRRTLEKARAMLDGEIEFERVRVSMGEEERLSYLTGYVPFDRVGKLEAAAEKNGWAVLVRDPDPDDPVPTLVKSPKPVGIIRPVFGLLGTVPGYREYDISFFFLVFFTVFFAMIIGDGAYGLLLVLTVTGLMLSNRKKKKPIPQALSLMLVLGAATTIWGAITGTWFGSQAIAETAPFRFFVIDELYSFDARSSYTVRLLCFVLGTIHLSIAHIWNFITQVRQRPRLPAFTQLAWLSMVLGLFFFVLNLVLDPVRFPIPAFSLAMVAGGFVGVLLFSNQDGTGFFKGALKGLADFLPTFLSGISAFADIISYIRLFAVGLASVEIAKSFNTMAASLGEGVVGLIGGAVILFVGHALNIAMAALSVIVHGVRLNMLEFSGHLGMEWSGNEYAPFAEPEAEKAASGA